MGQLERWVNELQCEIDKLKRIVIDGGGFDPSLYEYITPFQYLDFTKTHVYTITENSFDFTPNFDCIAWFNLYPDSDNEVMFGRTAGGGSVAIPSLASTTELHGVQYIKSGQTYGFQNVDTNSSTLVYVELQKESLTPRTTIIDRAIAAVKKVTKKRTTKKKED